MKTKNTPEQIAQVLKALRSIHISPFENKGCDPKYNAQRNLKGISHYVDDDTLRFHKSRVISSRHEFDGLLFGMITSDALDMHGTKRGFRFVVHDVFGTCVYRPDLENAASTSAKASKWLAELEIDVVAHYQGALRNRLRVTAEQAAETETALSLVS